MASKTRKVQVFDDENTQDDSDSEEELEQAQPQQPVVQTPIRVRKEVTVFLQEATSLTIKGMTFYRNQPTKVPAEKAKFFRNHGWFRVI